VTLELRVLSGARAGDMERFDQPVVAIGRHPTSDLRFDPQEDLDVSARHAELRRADGAWTLHDEGSTNGTFVNGERLMVARTLQEGDVVAFGADGPRVEVRMVHADAAPPPRRDTSARIAQEVERQAATLRRGFVISLAAMIAAGAVGAWWWKRQASRRERELIELVARSESTTAALRRAVDEMRPRDSAFAALLAVRTETNGRGVSESERQVRQSLARISFASVHDANDPAVALLASDLDGTFIAGTAFGVGREGLLVTNKHIVLAQSGQPARRLRVLYANTREWLPAHVVRTSARDDLALIRLDVAGSYPVVAGVSGSGDAARTGAPIASIGYPHAVDTPMEGSGLAVTARTTTTAGVVSKRLDDVLQIDTYAGKGSSGSPVLDARGQVVGVIYGGAPESGGRIVYAVPGGRVAAFLGADGASVVRR
jgi:S1-C subfamily serine protease